MLINMRYRSNEQEIMDDFDLEGEELAKALTGIARINRWLGGNKLTLNAVEEVIRNTTTETVSILDLGCGNGDMLRALSRLAKQKNYCFELTGVDANSFTIRKANSLSAKWQNICYECVDFLDPSFNPGQYDIILITLTLHHFTDMQIVKLLEKFRHHASKAIIINDLERSRLSYFLFHIMSKVFAINKINENDGKLSILRGFRKSELKALAHKLNFKNYTIRWKWAFRYQWIITDL